MPCKFCYEMSENAHTVNFVDQPFFSTAELAQIAGIDRGIADQWIHRKLITPTRVERSGSRRRPTFSVRTVFKAKLIVILNDHFTFAPGQSAQVANDSDCTDLASLLAGEDWMYTAARAIDEGRPWKFWVAVTRVDKRWRWRILFSPAEIFDLFGTGVPYLLLPLPEIFSPVYEACRAIHAGLPPDEPRGKPGA